MAIDNPTEGQNMQTRRSIVLLAWGVVFVAAILAYWPGLQGPFLLDDLGSIAALGDFGGVKDWNTFKLFVFGGDSGPTGRPLALLTFLADANDWPAEPYPFKRTNLVIHLLNGVLLGFLTLRILDILGWQRRTSHAVALASVACWLLHPYLVSTTLYAVQRMAQLSTLFIFAGMLVYLRGRTRLLTDRVRAYLWMSVSLAAFTFLGVISKENGILLPLLIGLMEITIFASQPRFGSLHRGWSTLFLVAPAVAIVVYLGGQLFKPDAFVIVPPRNFSIWERLLTEPRVLIDYLQHWFIPKLYTTGIFQDHFLKSTGLLTPVTTILALGFHCVLVAAAIFKRREWPVFAFAVLFFYGGHLLESTTLNLELYFEHRNYLSAAFLFLPLFTMIRSGLSYRSFLLIFIGFAVLLAGFTRYSATVWSSYDSLVIASARKAPTSPRAQSQYALLLTRAGNFEEAVEVLEKAIAANPQDVPLLIVSRLSLLCHLNRLPTNDFRESRQRISLAPFDSRSLRIYNDFAAAVAAERCPNISIDDVRPMFSDMLANPRQADPTTLENSHIHFLIGYVDMRSAKPAAALAAFEKSLASRPGASHAMAMAALMASNAYNREALRLSDIALSYLTSPSSPATLANDVSESDVRAFQETVRADLEAQRGAGSDDQAQ